jgi:hypothetical protein
MARKRLGRRERTMLKSLKASGMRLVDGIAVKFSPQMDGYACNVRGCLHPDMMWPIGKPSYRWGWDGQANRRITYGN